MKDTVSHTNPEDGLFDALPVIVRLTDADGQLVKHNQPWTDFTGRSGEASEDWKNTIHPEDRKAALDAITDGTQKRQHYTVIYRLQCHDGNYLWMLDKGVPRKHNGAFAGMISTMTDINDQKNAEAENIQRLKAVVDSAPFPIGVYIGREMRIALVNKSIIDIWGKGSDIIGKTYMEVLPELADGPYYSQLDQVFTTGKPLHIENQYLDLEENGIKRPYYFNYSFTPLFDPDGNVYGVMNTAAVVTDLNLAKKKIEESEAKFRNVTNSSPTGLWLADATGAVTYVNKTMVDWTGIPYESMLGNGWANAVVEEDRPNAAAAFSKAIANRSHYDVLFRLNKADGTTIWCRAAGDPYYDDDGHYAGFSGFCMDIDELMRGQKNLAESEARFRSLIEEAPVATCLFVGRELNIAIANEKMLVIMGKGKSVIGKTLEQGLPEMKDQPFIDILQSIFDSGETVEAKSIPAEIFVDGNAKTFYFDYTFKPIFDPSGNVYAIIDMSVDVTEQVLANHRIAESQKQLLDSFEQSPVGIAILKREGLTFTMANAFYGALVGRKPKDLIGKPLLDALPELDGQGFDALLENVIATGIPYIAKEVAAELVRGGTRETIYIDLAYQPHYAGDRSVSGVFVVAIDVTQQVVSRKKVEASEAKLRSVIATAPAGIGLFVGRDLIVELPNQTFIDIVGKGSDIAGKPLREIMPELETEGQPFLKILDDVFTTGKMFHSYGSQVRIVRDGILHYDYYNITYTPLFDENNQVYAILDIAIDVTETIKARQQAEAAEASLRGAVELAELATWSLDIKTNTFSYSQRFMDWLGFSDATQTADEVYNLLPGDYRQSVFNAIQDAIHPGGSGSYINEHPIINKLTGEQRIIHAQAQILYDPTGVPETLRGTAQDVTKERELQQQLEYLVKKRTEELQEANAGLADAIDSLQNTNAELAQFAYIASHDLQEPVRKMNIFAHMLEDSLGEVDAQSKNYLDKINKSAVRMMNLIRDVLAYSQLSKEHQEVLSTDLNEIAAHAIADFDLIIEQKGAKIHYDGLPVIEAIPLQMGQLFGNLISNSLKYSREGVPPVIHISAELMPQKAVSASGLSEEGIWYKLTFRDNGIGFQPEHSAQIFNIFQRLHGKSEFAGTGIGLAICKKIAINHHGDIFAEGEPGVGATFTVILPLRPMNR